MVEPLKQVSIQLAGDEALILFELCSRFVELEQLTVTDPAEAAALLGLCAVLERTLVEPLRPDYAVLLENARRRVRERAGL